MIRFNRPHVNFFYTKPRHTRKEAMQTKRHKAGKEAHIASALVKVAKEAIKLCDLRGDVTEEKRHGLKCALKELMDLFDSRIATLHIKQHATPSKL